MTQSRRSWPRSLLQLAIAGLAFAPAATAHADPYDHVTLGLGAAAFPLYQGADELRVLPTPVVDIEYGRFFAQVVGDGVGVNIIDTPHFQTGVALALMLGYREGDVPRGIGKLDSTLGARAHVAGQLAGLQANLSVVHAMLGGDYEGMVVNGRLSYPLWLGRVTVNPSVGVGWADGRYMRRYFGVNADQALASGLAEYRPSSGFKDIKASVGVFYNLTDQISLLAIAVVGRNLDEVTDSPFVESRWQPVGVLGTAYTF